MLGFLLLITIVFSFTSVQTWAAKKAVDWFNNKYDSRVSLAYFKYSFPNNFTLEELYLPGEKRDTIIYAQHLNFGFSGFYSASNTLSASDISIEKLRFNWITEEGDTTSEFQKFIKKFDSGKPRDPNAPPFQMEIGDIDITDGMFRFENVNCDSCSRYWVKELNLEIDNFDLDGSYVSGDIESFSAKERYSLDVYHLEGEVGYLADRLYAENLELKTSRSYIKGDIALKYDSTAAFKDFINQVSIEAELDEDTRIESEEIMFFASAFPDFDRFAVAGEINGIINDLKTKDLVIELGESTRLRGDIALKDPTNVDSIFLDARDLFINTTPADIRYINGLFSDSTLPAMIDQLGNVNFSGDFTGYLKDFKTRAVLTTDVGTVNADIAFHQPDTTLRNLTYKGDVEVEEVNLGLLLQDSSLGRVSARLALDGMGLDPRFMNTQLKGQIPLFEYNDYAYSNMSVNGRIQKGYFKGRFEAKDPNLRLVFNGNASFGKDTSTYNFTAKIDTADLYALNFTPDTVSRVSTELDIDFVALNYDKWQGSINVTNTMFEKARNFYFFEDIKIESKGLDTTRSLTVRSNILEADVSGNYTLASIAGAFNYHLRKFVKSKRPMPEVPAGNFNFDITINNTQLLTEIFMPELIIEPNSRISGEYHSHTAGLNIDVKSPGFEYQKNTVAAIDLQYNGANSRSELGFRVAGVKLASGFEIDSIFLGNFYYRDTLFYNLSWIFRDSVDSRANLSGYALQNDSLNFEFGIDSSYFNIGFQDFLIQDGNRIFLDSAGVHIEELVISNGGRALVINGNLSDNPNEILRLDLQGFGMDLANYFIGSPNARFKGELYGDVIISQILGNPRFAANLSIDSLEMNNTLLGNFKAESDWTYKDDTISLAASLQLGKLRTLDVKGYYQPDSLGNIDFDIQFDQFRLAGLNPLMSGLVENLRGYVNGGIQVSGNTGAPKVEGELELPKVAFTVSFLQTDYNLTGSPKVKILQDRISFPDLVLRDSEFGTEGKISGTVTHENFRNFDLDLRIDADELLALNTEATADNAYYGTAFVTGVITIKGPPDEVVIKADVSTQRDTRFNIPLDVAQDVRKSDFVTFINPNEPDTAQEQERQRVTIDKGITLDFNISVNRNAQVQIIIDQEAGTKLTSNGNGNIRLRIDPFQDMELYGTYTVYEGQFLFALENILKRNFRVERGGTVTWNGDPLDALVNITAEYTTRADPGPLVSEYNGGRTLVNIDLTLSGELMDPTINFAIEAPRANSTVQTVLANRLSDDTKMNQQVFSLLAFNRFAPDQGLADPGASTGREQGLKLLASRASSWINQLTGDYNVSLDYQAAGDLSGGGDPSNPNNVSVNSQEEVEVGVSKRFFNDRFTVNGAVGVPVGENRNQIAGDFEIEYNITEDGRLRAKAFNRAVQDQFSFADQNYQQGVGVFYRIDFDTYREFFYKLFNPIESTQQEDREKEKAREEEIPGPDEESIKEVKDGEKKDSTQTDDNQNNQGTPPSEEEGQEKDKQE
ncbi:MAG: hypothetical protein CMI36_13345 [Owenweeksia sp.]|nr:hypothetical protein [Owenweeksia sp.]